MIVEIRHFIPGRLRLYAPDLFRSIQNPEEMLRRVAPPGSVLSIRANSACLSVVIEFHRDFPGPIADLVRALRRRSLGQLLLLEAPSSELPDSRAVTPAQSDASTKPAPWWDIPLTGPTVSLVLAFFSGPWVTAINVPLMLYNSRPIGRRAWTVLTREHRLNVDFLDVLAIGVSMLQGAFVTGGIVVWLIRLGDWIRDLTAARSKRAVGELLEFQRKLAWVLRDGVPVAVPVSSIVVDDTVVVHSGEIVSGFEKTGSYNLC